jgi:O-antigen/teichoic acid export membrane protein
MMKGDRSRARTTQSQVVPAPAGSAPRTLSHADGAVAGRATDATSDLGKDVTSDLGTAVGAGLRWSLWSAVAGRLVRFLAGVAVARLLFPEDFGVYAVALTVMNLLMTVNDLGLIPTMVQWRGRLEEIRPTAMTLALVSSTLLYAGCYFIAPAFASAMGSPEAVGVVRLLTLEIVVDGLTVVSVATLLRTFRQNRLAQAELASLPVFVGLTVGLAALGAGAWSLAVGHLAANLVVAFIVLRVAKGWVRPGFDRVIAKRLLGFGLPLSGGFLIEAVLLNADYLIIGSILGPVPLGLYLLAYNISSWPSGLVLEAVRRVSIAGFSRLAAGEDLQRGFVTSFRLLITAILPVCVVLGFLAPPLIGIVYGDRWLDAAGPLRFLAVLAFVRLSVNLMTDVLIGAGHPWRTILLQSVWLVPLVPALVVGVRVAGVDGAAAAHAIVGLAVAIPVGLWNVSRIGIDVTPVLRSLVRPVAAAGVSAALLLVVTSGLTGRFAELVIGGAVACATYAVLVAGPRTLLVMIRQRSVAPLLAQGST